MSYITKSGIKIELGSKIASGGEGEVYNIKGAPEYSDYCVKIYYKSTDKTLRENKIQYMVQHAPAKTEFENFRLCWPKDLVYVNNSFAGFIMPKAFVDSVLAYEFTQLNISKRLGLKWQDKFTRNSVNGQISRLKLATNITAAIHKIHELGKYVFVDMKPQNILVTNDGKVSLIDLDSIQIQENDNVVFPGIVSTPEYSPPESKTTNIKKEPIQKSWDYFSLAVMLYEILTGIHPYAGTCKTPYEKITTTGEKIQNNLSPLNSNSKQFKVIPLPHNNLISNYSIKLKELFEESFSITRFAHIKRPSCDKWGSALVNEIRLFVENRKDLQIKQLSDIINDQQRKIGVLENNNKVKNNELGTLTQKVQELKNKINAQSNKAAAIIIPWILVGAIGLFSFVNYNSQAGSINDFKIKNEQLEKEIKKIPDFTKEISDLKFKNGRLEDEKDYLKRKYSTITDQIPFLINNVDFKSTNNDGSEVYLNYGEILNKSNIYYLVPRIHYTGYSNKRVTIGVKIYKPDGSLKRNSSSSPEGLTYEKTIYCYEGQNNASIGGWGNNTGNSYDSGAYRIEFWHNDKCIGSKSLRIYNW